MYFRGRSPRKYMKARGRYNPRHCTNYRIAGIFRGVIFSWFSWSRGEPRNICTRKSANRVAYRVHAPKTTKFFPQNSQNYDFHENITPRKIPTIRYDTADLYPHLLGSSFWRWNVINCPGGCTIDNSVLLSLPDVIACNCL